MDKFTHEEHITQPLQANNKQFKIAVTLTAYNGNFNVTDENNKFYFLKSLTVEDRYVQITIPTGRCEIESLKNEVKKTNTEGEHYTEVDCPFTIKPIFSTLGSIIEKSPGGPTTKFETDVSIRDLLGFKKTTIYEEYLLSPNSVDILSFDNVFL